MSSKQYPRPCLMFLQQGPSSATSWTDNEGGGPDTPQAACIALLSFVYQRTREHPAIDNFTYGTLPCRSLRDLSLLRILPRSMLPHKQYLRQSSRCMQGQMYQRTREPPAIDNFRRGTLPCRSLRDLSFLRSLHRSMLRPQQCLWQSLRRMQGLMCQPTRGDQAMQVKLTTCQSLKCCDRRSRCARRPSW